jgi:hypothetical protein
VVTGYRMMDHKRNEDIRELEVADISTVVKNYQNK